MLLLLLILGLIIHITIAKHMYTNAIHTVSFHNFKSQNFKLSVSNPKSKYVVYLSVLSKFQIARV